MNIAIIGSGISGLCTAYWLSKSHSVTLFEKRERLGGHTHTVDVELAGVDYAIDTGFIVFNKKTYPHFLNLLNEIQVPYQKTSMSFSVQCEKTGLEYNGTSLNSLFAQRANIFSLKFWKMIKGIADFNRKAKQFIEDQHEVNAREIPLKEFLDKAKIHQDVIHFYFIPMAAAVWSANPAQMWNFPAQFILKFWHNHGFLEINDRPQWYVIKGGSHSYINPLIKSFRDSIRLGSAVTKVTRKSNKVQITSRDEQSEFDAVVFACHSDQALSMLGDPSLNERDLLTSIPYQRNKVVLHTDKSYLPKAKLAKAAWNYHLPKEDSCLPTVTYNMNILQSIRSETEFNVTLNPHKPLNKSKILREFQYSHPVFSTQSIAKQLGYDSFIGENNTFFCGAYLGNGFHEDGVVSARKVCKKMGINL